MKRISAVLVVLLFTSISFSQSEFWGVTTIGGETNDGVIYKFDFDGTNYEVVHHFDYVNGAVPEGTLYLASDGWIWGTTFSGGAFASCIVYRYNIALDSLHNVWDFDITTGDWPTSGVVEYGGKIYGLGAGGGTTWAGVIYEIDMTTFAYDTLYNFHDATTGNDPIHEPTLIGSKLYGTCSMGGADNAGTLWEYDIATDDFTLLYDFDTLTGNEPFGEFWLASDGLLYGTTRKGGQYDGGVIYTYNIATSTYSVVYEFGDAGTGYMTHGGVVEGEPGVLYGCTTKGGDNDEGTLFKYEVGSSTMTWLHSFTAETDGRDPRASIAYYDQRILGTTSYGGLGGDENGTIYQYDTETDIFSLIVDLDSANGSKPWYGRPYLIGPDLTEVDEILVEEVELYPNPSSGNVKLTLPENGRITFTNSLGQIVYSEEVKSPSENLELDLPKGKYLWKFEGETAKSTGKMLIN